jgi:hypothetical protein
MTGQAADPELGQNTRPTPTGRQFTGAQQRRNRPCGVEKDRGNHSARLPTLRDTTRLMQSQQGGQQRNRADGFTPSEARSLNDRRTSVRTNREGRVGGWEMPARSWVLCFGLP